MARLRRRPPPLRPGEDAGVYFLAVNDVAKGKIVASTGHIPRPRLLHPFGIANQAPGLGGVGRV